MSGSVLVSLDGTRPSERILEHLEDLVKPWPSRVVLLHAPRRRGTAALERAEAYLRGVHDAWRERFTSVEPLIATGKPANAILHAAATRRCGLIALVTRGRRGWRRLLGGSTAESVLRHSSVPVLIARPEATCARIRTILVPLDATRDSLRILPLVQRICATTGARVLLVHVLPEGETNLRAARVMETARARLAERGVHVSAAVRTGDPGRQILALIDRARVPLVAMTTHGRSGLNRAVHGSVAEAVLRRSAAPVLLIRTRPFEPRVSHRRAYGAKTRAHPRSILSGLLRDAQPAVRPPSWFARI